MGDEAASKEAFERAISLAKIAVGYLVMTKIDIDRKMTLLKEKR